MSSARLTLCCFTTCLIRAFDTAFFNEFVGFGHIVYKKEAAALALTNTFIKFEMHINQSTLRLALADVNEDSCVIGQAVHHAAEHWNGVELRQKIPCAEINQNINIMAHRSNHIESLFK